ncbi:hypothetical protein [Myxosarcina sp. GI1(2024)]
MPVLKWLRSFFSLLFVVSSFYSCGANKNYRTQANEVQNLPQKVNLSLNSTQQFNADYLSNLVDLEGKLPIFWYDNTSISKKPRNDSANIIVLYTGSHFFREYNRQGKGKRWHSIREYLDRAHQMNKKVVLSVKQTNQFLSKKIDPKNPTKFANPTNKKIEGEKIDAIEMLKNFVSDFGSHPAVIGWYIADEPTYNKKMYTADGDCRLKLNKDYKCKTYRQVQGYTKCHAIKNTIRSAPSLPGSTKPLFVAVAMHEGVFIPFPRDGSRKNTLEATAAFQLKDCYDVLMTHLYSIHRNSSRSKIEERLDLAVAKYQCTYERLTAIGKPFMLTTQTHGTHNTRLPSKAEFEFITFASLAIIPNINAFGFYGRHASMASPAIAETANTPYIPYKKDGKVWLKEIWDETIDDLNAFRCASKHRVADLNPQVIGNQIRYVKGDPLQYIQGGFYKCPGSNKWYALVVNTDTAKAKNFLNQTIFPRKKIAIQIQIPNSGDRARLDDVAKVVNKEYHLPVKERGKLNLLIEPRGVRLISFELKEASNHE